MQSREVYVTNVSYVRRYCNWNHDHFLTQPSSFCSLQLTKVYLYLNVSKVWPFQNKIVTVCDRLCIVIVFTLPAHNFSNLYSHHHLLNCLKVMSFLFHDTLLLCHCIQSSQNTSLWHNPNEGKIASKCLVKNSSNRSTNTQECLMLSPKIFNLHFLGFSCATSFDSNFFKYFGLGWIAVVSMHSTHHSVRRLVHSSYKFVLLSWHLTRSLASVQHQHHQNEY